MSKKSRTISKVRLSRALGIALTPKAQRIMLRRGYAPGQHGRTNRKSDSDYAIRLLEKQRLRAQYGLREKQLRIAFNRARRAEGLTGENLVESLETRLDALVLRSGLARTIAQARQMVVHRHILVNGKLIDRPSFSVAVGNTVSVKPKSESLEMFTSAASGANADVAELPEYIVADLPKLTFQLQRRPKREEVPVTCDVQLVVEYYAAR